MNTKTLIYQWSYIVIATIISSIALYYYAHMLPELIPNENLTKEVFMCAGQILWQGTILFIFVRKKITTYLFQMITVSLIGSLALIPLLIVNEYFIISIKTNVLFFLFIVLFMITEHARRVKKLNLPFYLTISWVMYRILWIPILLFSFS
ncbi:hypothetical protein [Aquimarina addita]|uniref:hypothetical protein n=1 Tax=Aquimarina addita TaxID=870485 RepID=UPI0031ECE83E